jgi:hypothetical protein
MGAAADGFEANPSTASGPMSFEVFGLDWCVGQQKSDFFAAK